ncbi:allantoinase PuuE [Neomegalonema perideroedes]|uniref:allantoinase PuuE n=1 Tax=Neomegalonema perideroedes TaxID=217219 RepID=UPI000366A166|nr:allantoinase PuuE [Neomegalonema perideroedes]
MKAPKRYIRDMRGYGPEKPDPQWPGGARVCVQIVVNYEEGGENSLLHGDAASEGFLSEIPGAVPWPGQRHWNMESIYEYGARAGFWRVHRLLTEMEIPATVYGVATALARSPEQVAAMKAAGWEIASHGLKWIDHRDMPPEEEARQIREAIRLHAEVVGEPPRGWYTGRASVNTVRLTAAEGLDYISDTYDDDLPYWLDHDGHGNPLKPQLVIPYTLDANDMRFATPQGFNSGDQFFAYLRDSFDALYAEGVEGRASMMSLGLHCRLIGRPGRIVALRKFLEYIRKHQGVWIPTRLEIARHWREVHPYRPPHMRPSRMDRAEFVAWFGGLFGAPWVAERAFQLELGPAHDAPVGLLSAFMRVLRAAPAVELRAALEGQPELALIQKSDSAAALAELEARLLPRLRDFMS